MDGNGWERARAREANAMRAWDKCAVCGNGISTRTKLCLGCDAVAPAVFEAERMLRSERDETWARCRSLEADVERLRDRLKTAGQDRDHLDMD